MRSFDPNSIKPVYQYPLYYLVLGIVANDKDTTQWIKKAVLVLARDAVVEKRNKMVMVPMTNRKNFLW